MNFRTLVSGSIRTASLLHGVASLAALGASGSAAHAQLVPPPQPLAAATPVGGPIVRSMPEGRDPQDALHGSIGVLQPPRPHGWLVRDERTGKEEFLERPPGLSDQAIKLARGWLKEQGIGTGNGRPENQEATNAMPTLTRIDNTEDFPYCMNVRITWPTSPGYIGQCSGALIDARHIITAGHCAHNGNGGGWITPYDNPAVSGDNVFTVVPGYDDGYAPYGSATVTNRLTWSGWADDGDWDYDIAIMRLDRPVGALTGWMGYGTNNDADFYKDNTFWHRGYPGASPYDGTDMYSRSGPFDSTDAFGCDTCWGSGREVRVNSRGYNGESGTACYTIVGDDRIVYAVHSNGNDSTYFDCVRFDNDIFDDIEDFIRDGTPSTADLAALGFTAGSSSIRAGNSVSYSFTVINNSRVSRSASMSYSIYLSSNSTISTADRRLSSTTVVSTSTIGSNGVVVKSGSVTIPSDVAAGTWYLGVLITSTDADASNNDSSGDDAAEIYVTR